MSTPGTPGTPGIGTWLKLEKPNLQQLIDVLRDSGYRVVGPQVQDEAIVLSDLGSVEQLPIGMIDEQDGGYYRLRADEEAGWFDFVVGPQSLKPFVLPPRETLLSLQNTGTGWQVKTTEVDEPPVAVLGVRGCDLNALAIMDRVFLGGPHVDPRYRRRRESLFLVGVHCRRAAPTCFCHSLHSGPALPAGFDLGLSELDECFLVEVGSQAGARIAEQLDGEPPGHREIARARAATRALEQRMKARKSATRSTDQGRWLDTHNIRQRLLSNLEDPRWDEVAERCLACANCTMVCPTCFCTTVEEVADLSGENVQRQRRWESCFTWEHSYTAAGPVHPNTKSRYRQWLTHKLASWIDQFDTSGCVGCGRCITWCPVGIDLTEEAAAIGKESTHV